MHSYFCYTLYHATYMTRVAATVIYSVNKTALRFSAIARYFICTVSLPVRDVIILYRTVHNYF